MWHYVAVSAAVLTCAFAASPACKDPDGNDVDWWAGFKVPYSAGRDTYGVAWFYADANKPDPVLATATLEKENSAIGRTAQVAIDAKKASDQTAIFYNDGQEKLPPKTEADFEHAHMKGMMAFDMNQGFWFVHSVPNFVDTSTGKFSYPSTGKKFGQSFLCMTFPATVIDEIAKQFIVNAIPVYDSSVPAAFKQKYPRLDRAAQLKTLTEKACAFTRLTSLATKAGKKFRVLAKNKLWKQDLYTQFVQNATGKDMYVETWLNNAIDYLPSCDGKQVTNIRSMKMGQYAWDSADDHSKWTISKEPATVCIGDINRQPSQRNRGGGTVCFEHQQIWQFLKNSIVTYECCPGETGKQCVASPPDSIKVGEKPPPKGPPPKG
ncbi:deoxyribonuclease II [Aphelenchoides avenae]|nr:deoxyribonuclease II [Aphelenchus avenae]